MNAKPTAYTPPARSRNKPAMPTYCHYRLSVAASAAEKNPVGPQATTSRTIPCFPNTLSDPSTVGGGATEWHGHRQNGTVAAVVRSAGGLQQGDVPTAARVRPNDFVPPFRPDVNLARKLHRRSETSTAFRGIRETVRKWRRARRWLRVSSPDCMKGTGHERHVTHYGTGREKRENRVWHPIVVAGSPVARRHSYCPSAVRMLNRGGRQPRFRIPHFQGTASLSGAAPGRC